MEGFWWNRSKAWAARNRGEEVATYDFATRYLVGFSPLPAFRHIPPEEYRRKVAELVRKIEEDGRAKRQDDPVAGVERILNQNPYEVPTRRTKRSTRPLFHVASKEARDELRREFVTFLAQYGVASEALRAGNLDAARWFPEGCYPPALAFVGLPPPPRPLLPPTRRITELESGGRELGEIPVVVVPTMTWSGEPAVPRARGQPP